MGVLGVEEGGGEHEEIPLSPVEIGWLDDDGILYGFDFGSACDI